MSRKTAMLLDALGRYDINKGYKYITCGNAGEAYKLICSHLPHIMSDNYVKSNRPSYCVESHSDKTFDWENYNSFKQKKYFREEEWVCKHCYCQNVPFDTDGKIIDFQVPLKHIRGGACEGMGKIDLLAQKGNEGWLLEVKVKDSTEEPLRAIMEVYTYWKQLGGDQAQRFLANSALDNGVTVLKKAIVIYKNAAPSSIYYKLFIKPKLRYQDLMDKLGVKCFIAEPTSGSDNLIKRINKSS